MLKHFIAFVIMCLILLSGFSIQAQSESLPVFEPGPCLANFTSGNVDCGTVTVPQDRAHTEERTVRLAVAVFRARSTTPAPDPLIFLDGGPGARTLDSYTNGLGGFLSRINRSRDIIIFDYRGMGHSDPALTCPESMGAENDAWVSVCRARFAEQGVDVTDFTTRDNAADAADIIRALGYETYNIWGGSYGSSVALTLLRDHPENIRAAIITAMQPPQGDLQSAMPVYFQRTLDAISALCQADAACSGVFPGEFTPALAVIVERLNENPLPVTVHNIETGLTGDDVIAGFMQLLKDENNIAVVPGLIAALYAEQYQVLISYANALTPAPDPLNPIGAYLSMRCTDSILAVTDEAYDAALQSINPAFREGFTRKHQRDVAQCEAWGARTPTPEDRLPAMTDTPALIISGALDIYSSQEWLDSTVETLPNGYGFMLPYHLHYVIHNPCASSLLIGFIEDPNAGLDASCMATIQPPRFGTS